MTNTNEAERILQARARALARRPRRASTEGTMLEVLEFRLASERYAVESRFVRKCIPCEI
jgi:purine-binding chemotaxis protein CheW